MRILEVEYITDLKAAMPGFHRIICTWHVLQHGVMNRQDSEKHKNDVGAAFQLFIVRIVNQLLYMQTCG